VNLLRPVHYALLTLGLLLFAGCSLFSTRDAESPDSGSSSWEAPNEPLDVLTNLTKALSARNSVNYMLSFDSTRFIFDADNAVHASDPAFQNWNYESEHDHINKLLSLIPASGKLSVDFTQKTVHDLGGGDSVDISTVYVLLAEVSSPGTPDSMSGTADFYMTKGSELYWQIYRWRDTRSTAASTWSDLKSAVH
jgi:hypothetical protein